MAAEEGVDYAWSRPSIPQLAAAGKRFAVRYVSWNRTGKNLTLAEAQSLNAAGLAVVTNWEYDQYDQLGGFTKGVEHAREADRQHRACGGPPGRPIYFSTDFNATSEQLAGPVTQYFRGAASVVGLARVGGYGGIRTVRYVLDHGLARWAWQTYAWSGGTWDARAHIQQYLNRVNLAGGVVDLDRATKADYGQWTIGDDDMALTDRLPLTADQNDADGYTVEQVLSQLHASIVQGRRVLGSAQTHSGGLPTWWAPAAFLRAELAAIEARATAREVAIEAREVARDAGQTELIRGLAGLSESPVTAEQLAALTIAVHDAATAAGRAEGDRVLAVLARQESEREAALRAALAAETGTG